MLNTNYIDLTDHPKFNLMTILVTINNYFI